MSSRTRATLLVFSLAGLIASAMAAYVHYRLLREPGYVSICDVSATFSCSQVYSSRFGNVAGVPVAIPGLVFFTWALLLSLATFWAPDSVREDVPGYLFAGSTLALAVVLYLGYASFVLLKLVCVLCLITYAAVIGLFLVSGGALSFPMRSLPRRAARDVRVLLASPLALVLTVVLVGGAVSTLAFFPRETAPSATDADAAAGAPPAATAAQRSEFERYYTAQPRLTLVVPTEGAKVLIVKFNDYQCPPCRQTFMEYKSVLEKYAKEQPGAVRLVTRDFPLERECNAGVTTDLHASACEAAVAVRLAREKQRAEQMEQWLFDNQSKLTPDLVRQGAREVGQVTDFDARYASTLEAVKADIAYGRQLGVNGTPTFFVNGVRIGGLASVYFDQAIAYELARAGQ
jgi:uncharacterized membrane protein/protein-disulfide isomerase